jgi:hypothetical protein
MVPPFPLPITGQGNRSRAMFYKQQSAPPQVRFVCRNSLCGTKLKQPTDEHVDAFCCRTCERRFYSRHCRVCEALFDYKTVRRQVCGRSRCRHELERHPERYFGGKFHPAKVGHSAKKQVGCSPTPGLGHNARANPTKIGVQSGGKSGRGYVIIAGPAVHPINFTNWPELPPRPTLIKRTTPPVNVIGGHRFPGAPKIDLSSLHRPQTQLSNKPGEES